MLNGWCTSEITKENPHTQICCTTEILEKPPPKASTVLVGVVAVGGGEPSRVRKAGSGGKKK